MVTRTTKKAQPKTQEPKADEQAQAVADTLNAKAQALANSKPVIGTVASASLTPVNLSADYTTEDALRNYASEVQVSIGQVVRLVAAGAVAYIANKVSGKDGKPAEPLGDFKKRLAGVVHTASGVTSRSQLSEYVGVSVNLVPTLLKKQVIFDILHASGAKEATDLLVAWCNTNNLTTLESLKEHVGYATKAAKVKAAKEKVTADAVAEKALNAVAKKIEAGKGDIAGVAEKITARIPAAVLLKSAVDKMSRAEAEQCRDLCEARIALLDAHPELDPDIANDTSTPKTEGTQPTAH